MLWKVVHRAAEIIYEARENSLLCQNKLRFGHQEIQSVRCSSSFVVLFARKCHVTFWRDFFLIHFLILYLFFIQDLSKASRGGGGLC